MFIEQIMTSPVVTVDMDDSLGDIKQIFDHAQFHHVVVTDEEKLYGIISDRDLLKAVSPVIGTAAETAKDLATLNKKAHQIMTRHPISLKPGDGIMDAVKIFNEKKISSIPVADNEGIPVGIVSWRDIMKLIKPETFVFDPPR